MHADCFLWHSWNCAPQTHSTGTNICVDFYNVCQKQLEKWHYGDWFHHYNTVPAHLLSLQEFLDNNGKTINLHPLESLDVAPSEFFFLKLNWCWGTEISWYQHDSRNAGYIFRALNTECSKILSKKKQSFSFLNSFSRGLLYKGQNGLASEYCYH